MKELFEKGIGALRPKDLSMEPPKAHEALKEFLFSHHKDRMDPEMRKACILLHAVELTLLYGFKRFTRSDLAQASDTTDRLVNHYFGGMKGLHDEVFEYAVRFELCRIVGQGIFTKHPGAERITGAFRERCKAAIWE